MSDTVKRYTTSTNYCMIDEMGKRRPFNETEFVLADDYDRDIKAQWQDGLIHGHTEAEVEIDTLKEACAEQAKTIEGLLDAIRTACHRGAQDKAEMDEINAALEDTHE